MTLPGETVGRKRTKCSDCQEKLEIQVLQSAAGYYVGFWCDNCGPYSRESGYYRTREEAQKSLDNDFYMR